MPDWVEDLSKALPEATANNKQGEDDHNEKSKKTPQEHGWAQRTDIDYSRYTTQQAALPIGDGSQDGADTVEHSLGQWASEAIKYEWKDDYGDVGPEFPALEKQLFGGTHVRAGLNFDKIAQIKVSQEGNVKIGPIATFEDAGLHPVMLSNVQKAGYVVPTPVQRFVLPAVAKGYDVISCAQTGSGKTAAYLIPILSKLMGKAKKLAAGRPNPATFQLGVSQPVRAEPLVLVVCPTRELATQIFNEARRFCYRSMLRPCVIYGGGPVGVQIQELQKGCDVLISSPGRLCDMISRPHVLSLKRLKYMVIDEADEMMQSDWEAEMKTIMNGGDQEEGNIKYLMFSATFPKMCRELAKQHLAHDHVRIHVGRTGSSHQNIRQDIIFVVPESKRQALYDLLMATPPARTIIFVNSKHAADEIDDYLFNLNLPCTTIHGDRTQREREDSLRAFKRGTCPILIATGVSARGLDIAAVMHVVNYDMPSMQYGGIDEYIHRIGRTGRIGNLGLATSFYNERDNDLADPLVKVLVENNQLVPDFLQGNLPEGFTATEEGVVQGNAELLDFGDASDDENEEGGGNQTETGGDGGAWGSGNAWGGGEIRAAAVDPGAPTEGNSSSGDAWGASATGGAPAKGAAPGGANSSSDPWAASGGASSTW